MLPSCLISEALAYGLRVVNSNSGQHTTAQHVMRSKTNRDVSEVSSILKLGRCPPRFVPPEAELNTEIHLKNIFPGKMCLEHTPHAGTES